LNVGVADCHVIRLPGDCVKQSVCGEWKKIEKK
jgi:hypothetical protein